MESPDTNEQIQQTLDLKRYKFSDLKRMTRNFSSDSVIGEGRRSVVFKGCIDAETMSPSMYGFGMMVAIKKFRTTATYDLQEIQPGWWRLSQRLSHPNVIKLFGHSFEDKGKLLVYEFMQKGSLDKHLFNMDPSIAPICWSTRLRIAIGVARGLNFLHSSEIPIALGGLDPSNLLLDGSYNPKISSHLVFPSKPISNNASETNVRSALSYFDANYFITGKLTVKGDVYCFGILLLEILTGLRAFDEQRLDSINLVAWAEPLISHRKNLRTIIDARLDGQYSKDAAYKAAQLALKCIRRESRTQPTMKEVLEALERIERM